MTNNKADCLLGTVEVEVRTECPPSCHWHNTNVTHRAHYKRVPADVVTLQDAIKRLGIEEVDFNDWYTLSDYIKSRPVAFNDEKVTNCFCGGRVLYAFSLCEERNGKWQLYQRGYYIVRRDDGKLYITQPA